jgi:hypothetical protein
VLVRDLKMVMWWYVCVYACASIYHDGTILNGDGVQRALLLKETKECSCGTNCICPAYRNVCDEKETGRRNGRPRNPGGEKLLDLFHKLRVYKQSKLFPSSTAANANQSQ